MVRRHYECVWDDTDTDGIPDYLAVDSDTDGVSDYFERTFGSDLYDENDTVGLPLAVGAALARRVRRTKA